MFEEFFRHFSYIGNAWFRKHKTGLPHIGDHDERFADTTLLDTVAGYFLPPLLSRFRRGFPGVTVRMQEIPRDEIEPRIVDGRLDIAVMLVSNLRNDAQIDSKVLIRSPRHLWLCADHHLMAKNAVSLAEVACEPYVMLTMDEADRRRCAAGSRPRIARRSSSRPPRRKPSTAWSASGRG